MDKSSVLLTAVVVWNVECSFLVAVVVCVARCCGGWMLLLGLVGANASISLACSLLLSATNKNNEVVVSNNIISEKVLETRQKSGGMVRMISNMLKFRHS